MKKYIALLLMLAMLVSLAACGDVAGGELLPPVGNGSESGSESGSEGGSAVQTPAEVTVEPVVLLEQDGLKIQAKELDTDGFMGAELKLLIENNTDKNLTVQCRNSSVNGYMVETMMSAEVAAGKKANDAITFLSSDMELCGIETIADMEFSFHIYTTDDWDTYLDSDQIQLKTSAADTYSYTYDHPGELVYEGKGVKVVALGLNKDESLFGPGLVLYIQNTSDKAITVQSRDTSVNGFMVDTIFSQELMPGKHAVTDVTFMESDLEENDITSIEELELSFHIYNSETWKTIVDTDAVKLSFAE